MSRPTARRSGVLLAVLVTVGLLAPAAAGAAPAGPRAGTITGIGSDRPAPWSGAADEGGEVRARAADDVPMRDLSYACPSDAVPPAGFRDTAGSTFTAAIECLVWSRITQGTSATTYEPNAPVTRRQMAVFLHRLLDDLVVELPVHTGASRFGDVPATGEVGQAINVLASDELAELLGEPIVAGRTATRFDPTGRVTRAQMGSFIARTLRGVVTYHEGTIDPGRCDNVFSDEARIPATHVRNVKLLCAFGVVAGRTDGTYGPGADVTRGQMAAFLMRTVDVFVEARLPFLVTVDADRCGGAADGSPARPFCTIQAGIDDARRYAGRGMNVLVHGDGAGTADPTVYREDVTLASGRASYIDLVGFPRQPQTVITLDGRLRVAGDRVDAANLVAGFAIAAPAAGPALTVTTAGDAVVDTVAVLGQDPVRVDQTGRFALVNSYVEAGGTAVDLVRTTLRADGQGSVLAYNSFEAGEAVLDAYVTLPAGTSDAVRDHNFTAWQPGGEYANSFAYGVTAGTFDGRAALRPVP